MQKNMTTTLKAFKHACLVYRANPISYNNKEYHVSDLLGVKASVVAQCQRMVREHIYGTKESYGKDIRNQDNEKSFVIEQLLNTKTVTKPQTTDQIHVYINENSKQQNSSIENFQHPS